MHLAVLRPRTGRAADEIAGREGVAEQGALGGVKARQRGAQVASRVRSERRRFIQGRTTEKPAVDRLPSDPTPARQPVESVAVAVDPADVRWGLQRDLPRDELGRAIRIGRRAEQERNPLACTVRVEARDVQRALLEQLAVGFVLPVLDDALRHKLPPVAAAAVVTRVTDEVVAVPQRGWRCSRGGSGRARCASLTREPGLRGSISTSHPYFSPTWPNSAPVVSAM